MLGISLGHLGGSAAAKSSIAHEAMHLQAFLVHNSRESIANFKQSCMSCERTTPASVVRALVLGSLKKTSQCRRTTSLQDHF